MNEVTGTPGQALNPLNCLLPPTRCATSVTALSRSLAGALFAAFAFAWPLLICGTLKIVHDLLLLAQFRHLEPPEERNPMIGV